VARRAGAKTDHDAIRKLVAEKTPLGAEAQGYMDAGKLVPDDLILRMMEAELENIGDAILDGVGLDRINEETCGQAPVGLDRVDQPVQSFGVAAPAENCVISLLGEAPSNRTSDARSRTHHQTDRFHVRSLLFQ
jgi:hypothetical protein